MKLNAKQTGLKIGIEQKTVTARAKRLGMSKEGKDWAFNVLQIEQINGYVPPRNHNPKFSFSKDGMYLIINSKLNTIDI
jgi:heat shock protein HslJ